MGVPAVSELVFMIVNAPTRESGQAAPGPVGAGDGVPATYSVLPLSKPTVAAGTKTGPVAGAKTGAPLQSTEAPLGAGPPPSAPQFSMNACVSLDPKTAVKGWSRKVASVTV